MKSKGHVKNMYGKELTKKALDMRKAGAKYDLIAATLNVSTTTAYNMANLLKPYNRYAADFGKAA